MLEDERSSQPGLEGGEQVLIAVDDAVRNRVARDVYAP
jgi:hypothetical protein